MRRVAVTPRSDWQRTVESQGLLYHSTPVPYWNESAAYEFSAREIDCLEQAANDVHQLCMQAVQHILDHDRFAEFQVPQGIIPFIRASWENDAPTIYGRFDFAFDSHGPPKLLEYNADTPTSLLEAAVIQWFWLQDTNPDADQFNSLHERLIDRWRKFKDRLPGVVYFASTNESQEDFVTVSYLRDTAMQAELKTEFLTMQQIGWQERRGRFVDMRERVIQHLFKLYPWEWLLRESFGRHIPRVPLTWIEPPWKMLLSNKAILALLWELYPNHPNLLRAEREPFGTTYIRKPCLGREGCNIQVMSDGAVFLETDGKYSGPYVYQDVFPLPRFDEQFPVLGCWMVGDAACGLGVRESPELITRNTSRFVPHYFVP